MVQRLEKRPGQRPGNGVGRHASPFEMAPGTYSRYVPQSRWESTKGRSTDTKWKVHSAYRENINIGTRVS